MKGPLRPCLMWCVLGSGLKYESRWSMNLLFGYILWWELLVLPDSIPQKGKIGKSHGRGISLPNPLEPFRITPTCYQINSLSFLNQNKHGYKPFSKQGLITSFLLLLILFTSTNILRVLQLYFQVHPITLQAS